MPSIRKGQPSTRVSRKIFAERFAEKLHDPRFGDLGDLVQIAWKNYSEHRKAPRTKKAGNTFADPSYDLSVDWLAARAAIRRAERERKKGPPHFLVVSGSTRNEHTCPGEEAKSYRIAKLVERTLHANARCEVELLDLSRTTAEYGRTIHPCKACVSTAMPLCHWPCSCYPNHALGQSPDWMNEIYPMWTRAHGVIIVTPVNWYSPPSALKALMDRMVCADGGNPDPTTTHGKKAEEARALELKGWHFPQHLAGRAFGVIVHGDAAGVDDVLRVISHWLTDMGLEDAGVHSLLARYLGYYEPYPLGHAAFEKDEAFQDECKNVARAVLNKVTGARKRLTRPRPK